MKRTPDHGRWGILGGAFDPVHRGHLNLANEIRRKKKLTGILFVPSLRHPFKRDLCRASFEDRVAMLRLAVEGYEDFVVSEIETELNLNGYTLDTVKAFKQRYPETEFFFLIGADNLNELNQWYSPGQIMKEVRILVGSRPAYGKEQFGALPPDRIELIPTSLVDISSTDIRRRIGDNVPFEELAKLIPATVVEYIRERELYT